MSPGLQFERWSQTSNNKRGEVSRRKQAGEMIDGDRTAEESKHSKFDKHFIYIIHNDY